MHRRKVIIMGAAGRDFHNFNTIYRDDEKYHVVAFTATQIPDIEGRLYPPELAGNLYPKGIPIEPEENLLNLLNQNGGVDEVVFSYSDVSHEYVMHKASEVNANGASFVLLDAGKTMLRSEKPVVANLRCAHRMWQKPDHPSCCRNFEECRQKTSCCSTSDAVWKLDRATLPAICDS